MKTEPTSDEAVLDALVAQLVEAHRRVFPAVDATARRADLVRRVRAALGPVPRDDAPRSAWAPWTPEAEAQLRALVAAGLEVDAIAERLGRKPAAIRARLAQLALRDR